MSARMLSEEARIRAISNRYHSDEYYDAGEDVGYLLQVLQRRDRQIAELNDLADKATPIWERTKQQNAIMREVIEAVKNWRYGLVDKKLKGSGLQATYPAVYRLAMTYDEYERKIGG